MTQMMKKFVLALCATALVGLSAFGQTADELIEKNIKAHGGAEKLKTVKSVKMTGKMKMGPMEAPFVIQKSRPEMVRMDFTVQGMTGTQAYDGKTGWLVMPFMGKKDPEKMSDDQLKDIKDEADFDGPMMDYKAKGNKVEYLGKGDVQGTPAYKLKVTTKEGTESVVYLDADSYLEIKSESKRKVQGQEIEAESNIGNYKEVDGMLFPTQIDMHAKGKEGGQTIIIDKIELNPTLDAASFAMPEVKKAEEAPAKKN
jgi:outer membrane lipoprotein-sorting protein